MKNVIFWSVFYWCAFVFTSPYSLIIQHKY